MLYSIITDNELDLKIEAVISNFPDIGYRRIMGELERQRLRICRTRVRDALRRVDRCGVTSRWLKGPVSRRCYNVKSPLSLWHIDGNHKLIRYAI